MHWAGRMYCSKCHSDETRTATKWFLGWITPRELADVCRVKKQAVDKWIKRDTRIIRIGAYRIIPPWVAREYYKKHRYWLQTGKRERKKERPTLEDSVGKRA